eukprot:scaffold1347_cov350-Pavlova_lutheri.AAC.65
MATHAAPSRALSSTGGARCQRNDDDVPNQPNQVEVCKPRLRYCPGQETGRFLLVSLFVSHLSAACQRVEGISKLWRDLFVRHEDLEEPKSTADEPEGPDNPHRHCQLHFCGRHPVRPALFRIHVRVVPPGHAFPSRFFHDRSSAARTLAFEAIRCARRGTSGVTRAVGWVSPLPNAPPASSRWTRPSEFRPESEPLGGGMGTERHQGWFRGARGGCDPSGRGRRDGGWMAAGIHGGANVRSCPGHAAAGPASPPSCSQPVLSPSDTPAPA